MKTINLIEDIINQIPDDLDDLEKMYYIYIRTCQIFSYDTRYNDSPYILAELLKHNNQDIKNIKETSIVCTVWAKIFIKLLRKAGIKASLINRNGHSWVEGYVNNMIIYSDPTYGTYTDLARVKHNDSVHHFYPVTSEKTDKLPIMDIKSKFDIEELNKKIGYLVYEEKIFSDIENNIVKVDTLKEKVDFILKKAKLVDTDVFDNWQYIKNLLRVLLKTYHKQLIYVTLTKINDDYTFDNKSLLVVNEDDNYYYYLCDKDIRLINSKQLLDYANLGYGIKPLYDEIGVSYPLKFKVPKASLHYYLNIIGFKNKSFERCYNKIR